MARREYLSLEERNRFDTPPSLTIHQRPILVDLPAWGDSYLQQLHNATNKVGFILQLGFFRITTRFFVVDRFDQEIITWVSNQLRIDPSTLDLQAYASSRTAYRHREDILKQLAYSPFKEEHVQFLGDEAQRLAHLQTRPTLLLDALAGYLREHRIEIPMVFPKNWTAMIT